jgi:endonuclease/exonuclease/phosphatase family metal-dependent hydrolase
MNEILTGNFAPRTWAFWPPSNIRVVDWNIERGLKLPAIVDFLSACSADVLILQEADVNARRTQRLNIAEEIARKLGMGYVFGREFQELAEGSAASPAYIGQATLSRWPLSCPRLIRFQQQSGFWRPRWWVPNAPLFQERLGGRVALVTEVQLPGQRLMVYNLHLESRGDDQLRAAQLQEVLANASGVPIGMPIIVAGDMNADTSQPCLANLIERAGFSDAMGRHSAPTTGRRRLFHAGKTIDRAFLRGPISAQEVTVDRAVDASDHYPVSLTLRLF